MKPDREIFCKESFERYIAKRLGIQQQLWRRVPRSCDPPDFYLSIEDATYAVEVTSTSVMRKAFIGEETYEQSRITFAREIEKTADEAGVLSGTYIVSFSQPLTSSHFRQVKKAILGDLIQHIEKTQFLTASDEMPIYYGHDVVCQILKFNNQQSCVCFEFEDGDWTESPEFLDFVSEILEQAIETKKRKLEQKGEIFSSILLLLNTYPIATRTTYCKCITRVKARHFFHSIVLVDSDGTAYMLYTRETSWNKS